MWGSLAGKLGAKDIDINATLQKLGNAVAPPAGETEDGDYYYNDDDDDDDDYSEEGDDDDDDYDEEDDSGGGGFGLVGLLTRALDDRGEEDEGEDEYEEDQDPNSNPNQSSDHRHEPENELIAGKGIDDLNQNETNTPASTAARFPMEIPATLDSVDLPLPVPIPAQEAVPVPAQGQAAAAKSRVNEQGSSNTKTQLDNTDNTENSHNTLPTQQRATETSSKTQPQQNEDFSTNAPGGLLQGDPVPWSESQAQTTETLPKNAITKQNSQPQPQNVVTDKSLNDKATATPSTKVRNPETDTSSSFSRQAGAVHSEEQEHRQEHQQLATTNRSEKSWEQLLERRSESNKMKPKSLQQREEKQPEVKTQKALQTLEIRKKIDHPDNIEITEANESADTGKIDTASIASIEQGTVPGNKLDYVGNKINKDAAKQLRDGDTAKDTMETDSPRPVTLDHSRAKSDPFHDKSISSEEDAITDNSAVEKINSVHSVLEGQIRSAKKEISELKLQNVRDKEQSQTLIERMMLEFQEKEARLLAAVNEDRQLEVMGMHEQYQNQTRELEERVAKERNELIKREANYRQIVEKSEAEAESLSRQFNAQLSQVEQREARSVRNAEEKVAQIMAVLDERDDEIKRLKSRTKALESSMTEHAEGAEEAEEEVMELQTENETLQEHVGHLEAECAKLKSLVSSLEADAEQVGGLQMELTLLREDRDRLRAQNQSAAESAISSRSQLEDERDAVLAECRNLKQQLAANMADLEVAQADRTRIITANQNLEGALEAFQNERQAELDMLEEQRLDAEAATKAAHAASLEAIKQTHESELAQVQQAGDLAVKSMMSEIKILEANLVKQRTENSQTRRSLDEAIHRLQTNQEDVIDRTLMKNILLDWCTMKDKDKRHQVLELMASVLHFTEEEREKVHLTHLDIESVRAKVVGALAAPLPALAAPVKIEGNNVQEKWISFLLSETDDGN